MESIIDWRILDLESNKIVFDKNITALFSSKNSIVHYTTDTYYNDYSVCIDSSFYASIDKLLQDEDFKKVISSKSGKKHDLPDSSLVIIPKITLNKSSSFLKNSINGTVTIETALGHGSGFFINRKGLILTCYHVIKNSKSVEVFLNQGVSIKANVVKTNPEYDLALLEIPEINSTPLPLGNSQSSEIGSEVYALGTPSNQELNQSVSKGIISGKRTFERKEYLQTDASVSPGNSGGPMINGKGEVIGIVSAKVVSFGTEGIGFSIPIEKALENLAIQIK